MPAGLTLFTPSDLIRIKRLIHIPIGYDGFGADWGTHLFELSFPASFSTLTEETQNQFLELVSSKVRGSCMQFLVELHCAPQAGKNISKQHIESARSVTESITKEYLSGSTEENSKKISQAYVIDLQKQEKAREEIRERELQILVNCPLFSGAGPSA